MIPVYTSPYHTTESKFILDSIPIGCFSGLFLDVGCSEPFVGNQSYPFRTLLKWKGVAVDAIDYSQQWQHVSGCYFEHAVVTAQDKVDVRFFENPHDAQRSCLSKEGSPRVSTSLKTIVSKYFPYSQGPDFVSIDLEGGEYNALVSFPFSVYRPLVFVIEYEQRYNGKVLSSDDRVITFLLQRDYFLVLKNERDANYVFFRS